MRKRIINTATTKAKILAKPTLRIKDICVLFDCGYRRAANKAREFREWFEENYGYSIYGEQIPTTEFLIYNKYDEKRVEKYAKMGF